MTHFKYLLIVGTVVFFPFHSSWGMDDLEQEVAGTSTSAGPSLSVREITKQGFFAKYGDDIRMIKPVPRPGPSFSLVDLEPEKLANLQTYDPAELEKEDFLIFHGVNFNSFNVDDLINYMVIILVAKNPHLHKCCLVDCGQICACQLP